jgi:hypothetical protein
MYHPLPELGIVPGRMSITRGGVFVIYYVNTTVPDLAFERAAVTFLNRAQRWFPGSIPLNYPVTTVTDFLIAWDRIAATVNAAGGQVHCGAILTHAEAGGRSSSGREGGLEFTPHDPYARICELDITVQNAQIGRLTRLPWARHGFLVLCGCNTANPAQPGETPVAQTFALRQGVPTLGQVGFSSFSTTWDTLTRTTPASREICLWAYGGLRNMLAWGQSATGRRLPARVFR